MKAKINVNFINGDLQRKVIREILKKKYTNYLMFLMIFQFIIIVLFAIKIFIMKNDINLTKQIIKTGQVKYNKAILLKEKKTNIEDQFRNLKQQYINNNRYYEELCTISNLAGKNISFTEIYIEKYRDHFVYNIRGLTKKMGNITTYLKKLKNKQDFHSVNLNKVTDKKNIFEFSLELVANNEKTK